MPLIALGTNFSPFCRYSWNSFFTRARTIWEKREYSCLLLWIVHQSYVDISCVGSCYFWHLRSIVDVHLRTDQNVRRNLDGQPDNGSHFADGCHGPLCQRGTLASAAKRADLCATPFFAPAHYGTMLCHFTGQSNATSFISLRWPWRKLTSIQSNCQPCIHGASTSCNRRLVHLWLDNTFGY